MSVNPKSPESIQELLHWSTQYLQSKDFPSPRLDTELLLCQVLSCRRLDLYLRHEEPLSKKELAAFKELLLRRLKHEPVAYILGYKDFMSLRFEVNRHVLIPRPETELLVERCLDFAKTFGETPIRILDVGSGSGCIGISLLHALKNATLLAWDLSPEAIEVSRKNAELCGIEASRIQFEVRDALDAETWKGLEPVDILVSNPPYIARSEVSEMSPSVLSYEPASALFAEDEGLAFYKAIAQYGRSCLSSQGGLFVEIGYRQGPAVSEILANHAWTSIQTFKDYAQLARIVEARMGISV